jgi:outer membrane protein assembly factor BamB
MSLDARTGAVRWRRSFHRCFAASTAVANGIVYATLMAPPPCEADSGGLLVAVDARTGRIRWRLATAPTESSPLLVDRTLYFGAWDGRVSAVDLRTHRVRWSFDTGDKVKGGPAFDAGAVYVGSYSGRFYALDAGTGRVRWSAPIGATYATPAVADGRVYVGTVDGRIVALDERTGRVLWSRQTGSYVYAAAAVWRGTVYVGSYDHNLYALDAATGRTRWVHAANAPISGAPTILDGLVYFSTCGSCSKFESNPRARRTYALDARTGVLRWRFGDGEYSPVVADASHVYLTGAWSLYGLAPRRR